VVARGEEAREVEAVIEYASDERRLADEWADR